MTETEARLNSHEAVCVERYSQINARLKRIEVGLIAGASALIGAMGWAINLLIGLVAKL